LLYFGKKIAEHWDKKVPSFNDGLLKLATTNKFVIKVDFSKLQIQTEARIHALGVRAGG